jgi:hypothetical protein
VSADRTLANRIREIEETLRPLQHERAAVLDVNGDVVMTKDAETHRPYELAFSEEEILHIRSVRDAVFVHNHPYGWRYGPEDPRRAGYSFSPEDIFLACKARVAEIRAVSPGYRFSLQAKGVGWQDADWLMIETIFRGEYVAVNRELTFRVLKGEITQAMLQVELLHLTWARFAGVLGLAYQRQQE